MVWLARAKQRSQHEVSLWNETQPKKGGRGGGGGGVVPGCWQPHFHQCFSADVPRTFSSYTRPSPHSPLLWRCQVQTASSSRQQHDCINHQCCDSTPHPHPTPKEKTPPCLFRQAIFNSSHVRGLKCKRTLLAFVVIMSHLDLRADENGMSISALWERRSRRLMWLAGSGKRPTEKPINSSVLNTAVVISK